VRPTADHELARTLDAHRPELAAYCRRILGSAADADDAVQETMIRAWRSIDQFEHRSSLRTWLYRIARNICLDQFRSRGRRPQPVDIESGDAPHPAPLPTHRPQPGPDEAAVSREAVRLAFLAAVTYLPPRQRAALVLHDVFRWPAADVAALLGTTTASVNSLVQRARATLAEMPGEAALGPTSPAERHLADRYVDAFAGPDFAALARLEPAC
jgi:RNA polymerase sigma-70 factor, ECF subfamily